MQHFSSQNISSVFDTHPARDAERSQHALDNERTERVGKAEAPIGIFDSGVGGLTILSALRRELLCEHYIYFGDTAHIPYGARTDADITDLSTRITRFLLAREVKLIVVACNTASQAALNSLRATFTVPFVGVVPAVKPAARATQKGRIGIAATNQASKALYLRQLIDEFAEGIEAYAVGCPELVTLVEKGELDGPEVEETIKRSFEPLLSKDVDVIVLGCTHFPALRTAIERVTRVQVIDSGAAIAHRTHTVLESEGLLHPAAHQHGAVQGGLEVWCSGDPERFSEVASKILGYEVVARQAEI